MTQLRKRNPIAALFARDNRVHIPDPEHNLQSKVVRDPNENQFVAYVDGIRKLDRVRCIDWKTTSSRYAEAPQGLLSLDPQLICYSWIAGISEVAFVTFVRKNQPEIQYLKSFFSEEQRQEYGRLVAPTLSLRLKQPSFHRTAASDTRKAAV